MKSTTIIGLLSIPAIIGSFIFFLSVLYGFDSEKRISDTSEIMITTKINIPDNLLNDSIKLYFKEAYALNPNLPNGFLESISFNTTHLKHRVPDLSMKSHTGNPNIFGIMGLTDGGKNIKNTLLIVSKESGFSINELKTNPKSNILGTAIWFNSIFKSNNNDIKKVISEYLGFSDTSNVATFLNKDFAVQIIKSITDGVKLNGVTFSKPNPNIKLTDYFDSSFLSIYKKHRIELSINHTRSSDYPDALWVGTECFSSRNGTPITDVVIHDMEGHFTYTVYTLFQNCSNNVSVHYCLRSSDGFVAQLVLEADKAWHVGQGNSYSIGLEHEGFADDASWYTTEMYKSSANLVKDITQSGYDISPASCYRGPSNLPHQIDPQPDSIRIKGHCHYSFSHHWDPGPNWNWYFYYDLINGDNSKHPDIVIENMWTEPSNPFKDEPVDLYVKIKNVGDTIAGFISFDYKIDGYTIGSDTVLSLDTNETIIKLYNDYIFSNNTTFKYCANIDTAYNEQITANNSYCIGISVSSNEPQDITLKNVEVTPTSIQAGGTIFVSADQYYSGGNTLNDLPYIDLGYYLSTDCNLSNDDILLGSDSSTIAATDVFDNEQAYLTIPESTADSTYFIIFSADNDFEIDESNEDNNTVCVKIVVGDALPENSFANSVIISPSPTAGIISYSTDKYAIKSILVYDINGKLITSTYNENNKTIDITPALKGIYFLKFVAANGEVVVLKILKK